MLYHLAQYLQEFHSGFNVFNYLTLRAILGVLTALLISLLIGPYMIRKLSAYNVGQPIRDDGPESHLSKAGTPTMGGALIIVAIAISTLLWANLENRFIWVVIAVMFMYGAIGWVDDYKKLVKKDPKGLASRYKYLWQSIVGFGVAIYLFDSAVSPVETQLIVPFFKDIIIPLSAVLYVLLTYFVIVGTSNAVNLTDGLDGLAILPSVMVAGALGIFAYLSGHSGFAEYLSIPYIPGVGELVIFCGALVGAGLGFLWFNTYPAMVFMGDVGSLPLGAALGIIAVITKHEILLSIVGGLFVIETLSVIFQVLSYKTRKKRIFLMAPIHHHYELKGWAEPKIIVRFWIISIILALIGLSTLKLR